MKESVQVSEFDMSNMFVQGSGPKLNMALTGLPQVRAVKRKWRFDILFRANVAGVGVGLKRRAGHILPEICMLVLGAKMPLARLGQHDIIPLALDGIQTDFWQFGATAMAGNSRTSSSRTGRFRPVPGGVSGAHYDLDGAGTIGGWYKDIETNEPYMFSNWHVFTNFGAGKKGDDIIQPSKADGGKRPDDTVGYLERWVEVKFLGPSLGQAKSNLKFLVGNKKESDYLNLVDGALARPMSSEIVDPTILGATVAGTAKPDSTSLGHESLMTGRSGTHKGVTAGIDLDVFVSYRGQIALFEDVEMHWYPGFGIMLGNKETNISRKLDVVPFLPAP